jgi:hypothetical protein
MGPGFTGIFTVKIVKYIPGTNSDTDFKILDILAFLVLKTVSKRQIKPMAE